jgi:hypothetical protein
VADLNRAKPRRRDGYTPEDLAQVRATCLTVAATLGAHLDRICIVGGLAPSLLIDHRYGPDPETGGGHPGTADLDIGLAIALLDDRGYAEISARLRQEGFGPDKNAKGRPTPQRWKLAGMKVTVDFLLPCLPGGPAPSQVQPLEPDFGALVIPGIELAADERESIELDGVTLQGQRITRKIPVCGPGAFVVLKALAFADRAEPKDAYDLVYVIRRWPAGLDDVVARLAIHAQHHQDVVRRSLRLLQNDFCGPDRIGPIRASEFETLPGEDLDAAIADAHGYVDDLLRRCDAAALLSGH